MSTSTTTASSAAATKQQQQQPPLQPTAVNTSSAARALRHAQPAAVAALFVYAFPSLVSDPVGGLLRLLPLTAAAQLLWTVVCLAPAGAAAAKAKAAKLRPGEKRKKEGSGGPNVAVAATLSTALTVLSVPALHAAMVLLGAPVLTHNTHTFLAAAHLAVLGLLPLFFAHGVDGNAWLALGGGRAALDDASGGLAGAVLGAWLGAVPIPLDWDRDWQAWPVTIVAGMYAGWAVGRVLGGTVGYGWRVKS